MMRDHVKSIVMAGVGVVVAASACYYLVKRSKYHGTETAQGTSWYRLLR
jgi:hypothetical protein